MGIVQRRQRCAIVDLGTHLWSNTDRLCQFGATMHHAVANGCQSLKVEAPRFQPFQYSAQGGTMVNKGGVFDICFDG